MMKKRDLEPWELAECVALKKAVDAFNAGKPRKERLSQGQIAEALNINQGSVSAYLTGVNALNAKVASVIAALIGVPVESFSPRLAAEIAEMARAVQAAPGPSGISEKAAGYAAEPRAQSGGSSAEALLEVMAAMHVIQAGLFSGRLTDDQVHRLLQIRNEVVHQPPGSGEQGKRLQGLVAAAFKAEENGGTPDDLLKMYQLGMEKQFAQEGGSTHEPRKKRAR